MTQEFEHFPTLLSKEHSCVDEGDDIIEDIVSKVDDTGKNTADEGEHTVSE